VRLFFIHCFPVVVLLCVRGEFLRYACCGKTGWLVKDGFSEFCRSGAGRFLIEFRCGFLLLLDIGVLNEFVDDGEDDDCCDEENDDDGEHTLLCNLEHL